MASQVMSIKSILGSVNGRNVDEGIIKSIHNVKIRGRVYSSRVQKNGTLVFINIVDGSTVQTLQCVANKDAFEFADKWDELCKYCTKGSTLFLEGIIIQSQGSGQKYEMQIVDFKGYGTVTKTYPIASKGHISRDFLRTVPHLRPHTLLFTAIEIIKQSVYNSFHTAMNVMGIGEVQPTLITGNECESGAFPFTVTTLNNNNYATDFFHKQVYLTVSSQLHLEATVCGTLRDGYCMTTAFRAEPSTGPLHLAEFCMPEWELVDCNLSDNMAVAERSIKMIFNKVLEQCAEELVFLEKYRTDELNRNRIKDINEHSKKKKISINNKIFEEKDWQKTWKLERKNILETYNKLSNRSSIIERLEKYRSTPFIISSHEECVSLMKKHIEQSIVTFNEIPAYDKDFSKEHERYITEVLFDGMPVFVRYYPKNIKAFYMPVKYEKNGVEYVDCYDLLFPFIGEVVGGSQRESDYDKLVERMDSMNISKEDLQWYLDIRKYGSIPHGGAGLGFGRLFLVITDIFNIKDMQEFPRAFGGVCYA